MSSRVFGHEPINFRHLPPVIRVLIAANVAVFLASLLVGPQFYQLFGLVPRRVIEDRWIWQPISYLFIHENWVHLLFNLFALWMFGMPVESQWGGREFAKYYLLCGLGAALATAALSPHSSVPVIGASGPIYGLLVAFAMLYPDAVVYLYFLIPLRAAHMAILFGLVEFFGVASQANSGIARLAHLGGMVTGYLYIRWWWEVKIRAKAFWKGLGPQAPPKRQARRAGRVRAEVPGESAAMEEVDRVLDKILASGLDSLTEEEREIMRRYSERQKH
ncbi:MAG: rhomboid family intramembrane serine protease [Elusimicrobia bacterium]|nr:rhomboid family intramembrane serine protease [Elusimicrobiota bacterium]